MAKSESPDKFTIPKEPVSDPSVQSGPAEVAKPVEPALPLAKVRDDFEEPVKPKVSPRYAYECFVTVSGKKYGPMKPEGGAVDPSEAIERCVSANDSLRNFLPGTANAAWKVKRTSTEPINKSQLSPEQLEALKGEKPRGNAA